MILARAKIRSPYRTGRNGIDINCFEQTGIPALGKAFQQSDSVAIMLNPHPRTDVVKRQPEVHSITVTRGNYRGAGRVAALAESYTVSQTIV